MGLFKGYLRWFYKGGLNFKGVLVSTVDFEEG